MKASSNILYVFPSNERYEIGYASTVPALRPSDLLLRLLVSYRLDIWLLGFAFNLSARLEWLLTESIQQVHKTKQNYCEYETNNKIPFERWWAATANEYVHVHAKDALYLGLVNGLTLLESVDTETAINGKTMKVIQLIRPKSRLSCCAASAFRCAA